jgi:hypothetical protein
MHSKKKDSEYTQKEELKKIIPIININERPGR